VKRSRSHLFAVFVALCTLVLVMTGAAVTSLHDRPNQDVAALVHLWYSVAVVLLTAGLAIMLARTSARMLGWTALAISIVQGGLGHHASGPVFGTTHAALGAILFATLASIVLITSRSWRADPELVQDYGWPSNRFMTSATAFLILVQVGFGAGFRHSAVGVLPHLLGALIVALFIMIAGAFITTQFPKHPTLRPLAVALMTITGIQVFLGMTAFLMRLMETAVPAAYLLISVAHVGTGSLTLAASVMLAIEVRRCVQPRSQPGAPKAK
jgi:hypothetical protein